MDKQYVSGIRFIDELVCRDDATPQRLYACQDANFNLTAVTDISASVAERYLFDPYGMRSIYEANWTAAGSSAYFWVIGQQGLMSDEESGHIYNRMRCQHPGLGRFLSRDPAGYFDGSNLYEYLTGRPTVLRDPSGLQISLTGVAADLAAAIAAGDVATVRLILQTFGNLLSVALVAAATAFLAKVALCESIYNKYHPLKCTGCKKCTTKSEAAAVIVCLNLEIQLRGDYIDNGCDFVLAGSIAIGSQAAQDGHVKQVLQLSTALARCLALLPTLPD
jgi:RHS repeat-associated protein